MQIRHHLSSIILVCSKTHISTRMHSPGAFFHSSAIKFILSYFVIYIPAIEAPFPLVCIPALKASFQLHFPPISALTTCFLPLKTNFLSDLLPSICIAAERPNFSTFSAYPFLSASIRPEEPCGEIVSVPSL